MNLNEQLNLDDDKYGLLFDVRRSIRYHERRSAFYERLHHITSLLTILLAGSVLFDLAKTGSTEKWLIYLSVVAAILAALDMVIRYSSKASLHTILKNRFADLEIDILSGPNDGDSWVEYQKQRLLIEKDEPAIYQVLDGLCRNELMISEGFNKQTEQDQFFKSRWFQRLTANFFHWQNVTQA